VARQASPSPQAEHGWSTEQQTLLYCLATYSCELEPLSYIEKPGGVRRHLYTAAAVQNQEIGRSAVARQGAPAIAPRRQTGTPTCSKTSRPLPIGPSPAPFAGRPLLLGPSTPSPASEIIAGRLAKTPPRANSRSTLPGECRRLSWSSAAHVARASGGGAGSALPLERSAGGPGSVHSRRLFEANRCCLFSAQCRSQAQCLQLAKPSGPHTVLLSNKFSSITWRTPDARSPDVGGIGRSFYRLKDALSQVAR